MTEATTEHLRRYEDSLDRLRAFRVRIAGTRLDHYLRALRQLAPLDERDIRKTGRFSEYCACLHEASEVNELAAVDPTFFDDPEALRKLRDISGGKPFVTAFEDSGDDPARNAAFELTTAYYLQNRGAFAGFSKHGGDLLVRDGRCIRPGECKRLSSSKNFDDIVRSACSRLRRDYFEHRLPAGIGFVDVTRAAGTTRSILLRKTDDEIRAAGSSLLETFVSEHRDELQKEGRINPAVLGFALRAVYLGTAGGFEHVRRFTSWTFFQHNIDGTVGSELFRLFVEGLDNIPLLEQPNRFPPLPAMVNTLVPRSEIPQREAAGCVSDYAFMAFVLALRGRW